MAKDGEQTSRDHGINGVWGAIDGQRQQLAEIRTMLNTLTVAINARLPAVPDLDVPTRDQHARDPQVRVQQAREPRVGNDLGCLGNFPRPVTNYLVYDGGGSKFDELNCMNHSFPKFQVQPIIPNFDGFCHPDDFIYWFRKVDKFLEYMEIPKEKEVRYVAYKLQGYISTWWEQLQSNRRRQYKQPIRTWCKMRQLMAIRFLQSNHGQLVYQEYLRKLESKRLFRDNFDSQYPSQYNNDVSADTNYSRNMSKSSSQSSSESQKLSQGPSNSNRSLHNCYDGFGFSKQGDKLKLDEKEANKSDIDLRADLSQERARDNEKIDTDDEILALFLSFFPSSHTPSALPNVWAIKMKILHFPVSEPGAREVLQPRLYGESSS
ncbi:hypothetical protein Vadar_007319 [Vaccinium darrowii]|uniref:Uncharacterized protein n=1 Tax=Vaccinium darrowii TaxID=229202 RepID=A0ACB7WYM6_9ERIC|nr:hypothetical protein Vadar_007319 [Vaccinium darrowii]